MRVTFLGHACHLVELGGLRLLTDPWLVDPIFGGLVERDPPLAFGPADLPPIDALLLTHGHLDHFNAPTLAARVGATSAAVLPAPRCRRPAPRRACRAAYRARRAVWA